jgi:hypothetical protein
MYLWRLKLELRKDAAVESAFAVSTQSGPKLKAQKAMDMIRNFFMTDDFIQE